MNNHPESYVGRLGQDQRTPPARLSGSTDLVLIDHHFKVE